MRSARSSWSPRMSEDFLRRTSKDQHHLEITKELEFTSYMTVPLMVGDRVLGTVTLVSAGSGRRFTEADLAGAEELAAQVAGVVERARQFDWERQISRTLQQSLLPDRLPAIPGLALACKYLPAAEDAEVGGDWYDAVSVDKDRVALIVGDVEGHDMVAASVMGRLRHGLALLLTEGASPQEAIKRLNGFVVASAMSHIATVLVADVEMRTGAVRVASAGHAPPIVVDRSGSRVMSIQPGPPLGIEAGSYPESTCQLERGGSLVLSPTDWWNGVELTSTSGWLRPSVRPNRLPGVIPRSSSNTWSSGSWAASDGRTTWHCSSRCGWAPRPDKSLRLVPEQPINKAAPKPPCHSHRRLRP